MKTGIIFLLFAVLVLILIVFRVFTGNPRRSLAKEALVGLPEYRNASDSEKRDMEDEWLAADAAATLVHGVEILPGEEFSALDGHISYFDLCIEDDEWKKNLEELPAFLELARDALKRRLERDAGQIDDEWPDINQANELISLGESIVSNPSAAHARWRRHKHEV